MLLWSSRRKHHPREARGIELTRRSASLLACCPRRPHLGFAYPYGNHLTNTGKHSCPRVTDQETEAQLKGAAQSLQDRVGNENQAV